MKLNLIIPETLDDVTLEQYVKFEKLNTEDNKNSTFIMQKLVEIFCGIDLEITLKIKYNDLVKITEKINKVINSNAPHTPRFTLDGVEYGFVPNLDDITLGEYIDLDNYLTSWETMDKALSVLYRPITVDKGDRYLIEEYDGSKYSDAMSKSPLSVAVGAMVFFWNLNKELLNHTLNYLQKETADNLTLEELKALDLNGVGISQSMHSLQEILKDLNISQSLEQ